jgi:hypothetical protein
MNLTFRCRLRPLLLGLSLLGLSGVTLAATAPRSSTGDDSDAKPAAASEPTESTRFLHDERRVTQASSTASWGCLWSRRTIRSLPAPICASAMST